jgi:hypothetical protein
LKARFGIGDVAFEHREVNLPVVPADGVELAALTEVEDLFAWTFVDFTAQVREEVVTVEVHLPLCVVGAVTVFELLLDFGLTSRCQ